MGGPIAGLVGAGAAGPAHRSGPGKTRAKEHQMTRNVRPDIRILGSLRSADGAGVVRIEDRYDTDVEDPGPASHDPRRLARCFGPRGSDPRPASSIPPCLA